jgi:hypothetical protein
VLLGKQEIHTGFLLENLVGRDHFEELDVDKMRFGNVEINFRKIGFGI